MSDILIGIILGGVLAGALAAFFILTPKVVGRHPPGRHRDKSKPKPPVAL
jgi:hypothetical protein